MKARTYALPADALFLSTLCICVHLRHLTFIIAPGFCIRRWICRIEDECCAVMPQSHIHTDLRWKRNYSLNLMKIKNCALIIACENTQPQLLERRLVDCSTSQTKLRRKLKGKGRNYILLPTASARLHHTLSISQSVWQGHVYFHEPLLVLSFASSNELMPRKADLFVALYN